MLATLLANQATYWLIMGPVLILGVAGPLFWIFLVLAFITSVAVGFAVGLAVEDY